MLTQGGLEKRIAENINLIKGLQKNHIHDIHRIVTDGVTKGRLTASIANELMGLQRHKGGLIDREIKSKIRGEITRVTSIHENQARFWARDQVSKALSEINRMRQEMAGFPGYIWRTMQDMKVRDTHESLEGTYHEWSNPSVIVRSTGAVRLHPGEDYNCRCWPEAAMGPEMKKPGEPENDQQGPDDPENVIVNLSPLNQEIENLRKNVSIPEAKIRDYLLNINHSKGKSKAKFFIGLGFNLDNSDMLESELLNLLFSWSKQDKIEKELTSHGVKYKIWGKIDTPKNKTENIFMVWINDIKTNLLRFITAYPRGKK